MSLEYILLGMLRDPASGYELRKEFDRGPRRFWSARLSQIYPALQKMEERGWLRSRPAPSSLGPDKRVYRRTRAGTSALHRWLRAEPAIAPERLAHIGQLAFMGEIDDLANTLRFVEQLRDRFGAAAAALQADQATAGGSASSPGALDADAFHEHLCIRFGLHALQGKITACDDAAALIRARLRRTMNRRKEPRRG